MKILLSLLLVSVIAICCTTKTEVFESQRNQEFANGRTIFVKKTDEISRSFGAITGHLWNERHTYRYQFTIEPDEIEWQGLLGEMPKSILFCGEELLLKTTTEQVISDTVKQTTLIRIKPEYYKYVDKRYIFKLFGEQYFITIDSTFYQAKAASCTEEYVPNM